jgi:UDP-GlcNAc:undecaprenyl-phosphate GlcNAc-1-phosphate transferase
MAASTMVIGGRTENVAAFTDAPGLTFFRFAPLFIPFFILGVPILDTGFAIIRRTARRSNFAERDLGHLHHRLVRLGHGHRRAVLILWAWTALLSAFVLVPTFAPQANAYVPIGLAAFAVGLYTIFRPAGRAVPASNGDIRAGDELSVEPEPDVAGPDVAGPATAGPAMANTDPTSVIPALNGHVRAGEELSGAPELDAARDEAATADPTSFAHHDDQV